MYFKDLVSAASATKTGLSYTIRPDANWYWGGKKLPVTYKDFVYTWQQYIDPKNDVVSRSPYDQIAGFTHKGAKQITFSSSGLTSPAASSVTLTHGDARQLVLTATPPAVQGSARTPWILAP